jgi:hypothetical protein
MLGTKSLVNVYHQDVLAVPQFQFFTLGLIPSR